MARPKQNDICEELIIAPGPLYYFEVNDRYHGPFEFATIAIIHKIKEECRNGMA